MDNTRISSVFLQNWLHNSIQAAQDRSQQASLLRQQRAEGVIGLQRIGRMFNEIRNGAVAAHLHQWRLQVKGDEQEVTDLDFLIE